ncbi:MurR/RpiR family transcriptional regulator [Enterococcus canis]|nr:MurR/RpiR family transcriptional regulator [Enterococcus canis]
MLFEHFDKIPQFSETDASIYNYIILEHRTIPEKTLREIAQETHTSTSSVMRLIRKLGFDSFPELKTYLKNQPKTDDSGQPDYRTAVMQLLDQNNFSTNLEDRLTAFAQKLQEMDSIVLIGIGISGVIAEYGALRLATLGLNSFALDNLYYPLHTRLQHSPKNMLIYITNSGKTVDLLDSAAYFKPLPDFTSACITSDETSPIAQLSDYVFVHKHTIPRNHGIYDAASQMPTIYILELLIRILEQQLFPGNRQPHA